MKKMIFLAAPFFMLFSCNNEKKEDTAAASNTATPNASTTDAKIPQIEITDAKYTAIGKRSLQSLEKGDIAGMVSDYADTASYRWNSGDSLMGKKAITDYWTKRRTQVIDSLKLSQDIWLPVKVNRPQQNEQTGVWLMEWNFVEAKYKNGKRMAQWTHFLMHFNSADKIDNVIQFIDKAPINAATGK